MSGNIRKRFEVVTANARSLPDLMYSVEAAMDPNIICTCPPSRAVSADAPPRYGTCTHVDPSHHLEQFARHVGRGPIARRCHADLARIGFRIGDELGNGFGRKRWTHHHDKGLAADASDRRNVVYEMKLSLSKSVALIVFAVLTRRSV